MASCAMKAPNPPRKPRQNRRAGHPKRAQLLRRDRLEKLLALLRDRGPITPSKLRSLHRIERWEVKQAELLGWVEVGKGPRPRSGPRPTLVWPEEDTFQARLPVEEWEVPFVIPAEPFQGSRKPLIRIGHNQFSNRTPSKVRVKQTPVTIVGVVAKDIHAA